MLQQRLISKRRRINSDSRTKTLMLLSPTANVISLNYRQPIVTKKRQKLYFFTLIPMKKLFFCSCDALGHWCRPQCT